MPEVSRFYGIVIQNYFGDHPPPHFHALYAGDAAKIAIETLQVIDGSLPGVPWRSLLIGPQFTSRNYEKHSTVASLESPGKIAPLE